MKKVLILPILVLGVLLGGASMIVAQVGAASGVAPSDSAEADEEAREQEESKRLDSRARIVEGKARDLALGVYTGDGKLTGVELEKEHGILVYEVEFTESDGNEVEVQIDAENGTIVGIEDNHTKQNDNE